MRELPLLRFGPWLDKKRIQKGRHHEEPEQSPKHNLVTLASVINHSGENRAHDATPHVEKAHGSTDRSEILATEKIAHRGP